MLKSLIYISTLCALNVNTYTSVSNDITRGDKSSIVASMSISYTEDIKPSGTTRLGSNPYYLFLELGSLEYKFTDNVFYPRINFTYVVRQTDSSVLYRTTPMYIELEPVTGSNTNMTLDNQLFFRYHIRANHYAIWIENYDSSTHTGDCYTSFDYDFEYYNARNELVVSSSSYTQYVDNTYRMALLPFFYYQTYGSGDTLSMPVGTRNLSIGNNGKYTYFKYTDNDFNYTFNYVPSFDSYIALDDYSKSLNATTGVLDLIGDAFSGIGRFMSIEVLPHITLGMIISIPIIVGIILLVVKVVS